MAGCCYQSWSPRVIERVRVAGIWNGVIQADALEVAAVMICFSASYSSIYSVIIKTIHFPTCNDCLNVQALNLLKPIACHIKPEKSSLDNHMH